MVPISVSSSPWNLIMIIFINNAHYNTQQSVLMHEDNERFRSEKNSNAEFFHQISYFYESGNCIILFNLYLHANTITTHHRQSL